MEKIRNRYVLLICIIGLTSILVNFISYDTYYKAEAGIQAIENIPLEIGSWRGRDIPLENRVYEILETKSIIHRVYNSNGWDVFLSIVHYPETKVDFHTPESCLGGKGIRIRKSYKDISLGSGDVRVRIRVNELMVEEEGKHSLVYYFYKAGKYVGQSYIRLRLSLALNRFSRNLKSGSLIRVSTPVVDDLETASDALKGIIAELYPFVIDYL